MGTPARRRTLIVANLTAATPFLLQEVQRRAAERPTSFKLLIPNSNPNRGADWSLETALRLLTRAAGTPVEGFVGGEDAYESIKQALEAGSYDDVLISTLPPDQSEWLQTKLPARVEALGTLVSVVTPPEERSELQSLVDNRSANA